MKLFKSEPVYPHVMKDLQEGSYLKEDQQTELVHMPFLYHMSYNKLHEKYFNPESFESWKEAKQYAAFNIEEYKFNTNNESNYKNCFQCLSGRVGFKLDPFYNPYMFRLRGSILKDRYYD